MKLRSRIRLCSIGIVLVLCMGNSHADVTKSQQDGFLIRVKKETVADAKTTYNALVAELSQWWDASHSYSGKAENLSMDLKQRCMLEALPDSGFVRHMEIVYHQPGKALRLSGGLGPLQEMGVSGALTFKLLTHEGKTEIQVQYWVTGSSIQSLDKIAPAVDRVLTDQLNRLVKHCDGKVKKENTVEAVR